LVRLTNNLAAVERRNPMHPIFELIDADDAEAVRQLLSRDPAAAEARDEQGLSPIVHAAYRGHADVATTLPALDGWDRIGLGGSEGLPAPDAWSADGFTPLHLAAFAHNAEAATRLLEAGADPNVLARATFARVTPLGTCAFAGATEVARILLEHGADASIAEEEGTTPLDVARANGHEDLVELLGR
jgi:ankyrin repeat protein